MQDTNRASCSRCNNVYVNFFKFVFCSFMGIFFFFIPFFESGGTLQTFMVYSIDIVKNFLKPFLPTLTMVMVYMLIVFTFIAKLSKKHTILKKLYGSATNVTLAIYCIGALLGTIVLLGFGPDILHTKMITGNVGLAQTVIVTIVIAGLMVPLLVEFGLLEMLGRFIEPFMRPLFKVPGCASIDAVTSFVANPTVGVFFTNKLYCNGLYTGREAASIATGFSFISLGFFAIPCQFAGILNLYGTVVLSSFVIAFILAAIMIRIPPISRIPDTYIDGTPRETVKQDDKRLSFAQTLSSGYKAALQKAEETNVVGVFKRYAIDVFVFAQKVTAVILCFCSLGTLIIENTSIFHLIGMPFVPLLKLLQIPNASEIGPAMFLAFVEVSLPSVFIADLGVTTQTAFFVVTISTLQIINLGSSMIPIIESNIPLNLGQCIIVFFLRTLLAIPIVGILSHILF